MKIDRNIINASIDESLKLLSTIAPLDVAGRDIRIYLQSEIDVLLCGETTNAITGPGIRAALKQQRGSAIVVNDAKLSKLASAYGVMAKDRFSEMFKAKVVHEFAHALQHGYWADCDGCTEAESAEAKEACEFSVKTKTELRGTSQLTAMHLRTHGPMFIRAAVHLWRRAVSAGELMFSHEVVGYFPLLSKLAWGAAPILDDECVASAAMKITDVLKTPAPPGFREISMAWLNKIADAEAKAEIEVKGATV